MVIRNCWNLQILNQYVLFFIFAASMLMAANAPLTTPLTHTTDSMLSSTVNHLSRRLSKRQSSLPQLSLMPLQLQRLPTLNQLSPTLNQPMLTLNQPMPNMPTPNKPMLHKPTSSHTLHLLPTTTKSPDKFLSTEISYSQPNISSAWIWSCDLYLLR